MTISWQTPEQRIAELEELLRVLTKDSTVLKVQDQHEDRRTYWWEHLGQRPLSLTARQANAVWSLNDVPIPEDNFADVLIEIIQAPLEDRNA